MKDSTIKKGMHVKDTIVSTTKTIADYIASTTEKEKLLNVHIGFLIVYLIIIRNRVYKSCGYKAYSQAAKDPIVATRESAKG